MPSASEAEPSPNLNPFFEDGEIPLSLSHKFTEDDVQLGLSLAKELVTEQVGNWTEAVNDWEKRKKEYEARKKEIQESVVERVLSSNGDVAAGIALSRAHQEFIDSRSLRVLLETYWKGLGFSRKIKQSAKRTGTNVSLLRSLFAKRKAQPATWISSEPVPFPGIEYQLAPHLDLQLFVHTAVSRQMAAAPLFLVFTDQAEDGEKLEAYQHDFVHESSQLATLSRSILSDFFKCSDATPELVFDNTYLVSSEMTIKTGDWAQECRIGINRRRSVLPYYFVGPVPLPNGISVPTYRSFSSKENLELFLSQQISKLYG